MKGVKAQPYLSLDPFIDLKAWAHLDQEIKTGLCFSEKTPAPGIETLSLGADERKNIYHAHQEFESLKKDHPLKSQGEILKNRPQDFELFLKLHFQAHNPHQYIFLRNYSGERWCRRYEKYCYDTENIQFFPETMKFIKQLPFEQIGRVYFFLLDHDVCVPAHRDRVSQNHFDHFIWLSGVPQKKLYIQGHNEQDKIYVNSVAAYFNHADLHGVEAQPVSTYSLKIDGVFRQDFLEELCLLDVSVLGE